MEAKTILSDLRDIRGVTGSFVLSAGGEPKLSDLPAVIRNDILGEVGPRIVRLLEAFSQRAEVDSGALRFTNHRLYLRPAGAWLLCVLSEELVNAPTLQMGMTLVARRLATMTFEGPESPRETAPPTAPSAEVDSPQPTTRRPRIYRGQKVE